MRYLSKVIFLNSAHVPYAEVKVDGNVHFIGTQGVGKSTLLRAILFFYNADKLRLGIPKEKKNFDSFYLPYSNSYIVYEVMRENGAYTIVVTKSMGRAAFRFIDAPFCKEWFVNDKNEVAADWTDIRCRISASGAGVSSLVTGYDMFRDIIFGNNRKPDMVQFCKYAIVESSRYQNIPRTIQNVFLNSKLDADFIKDTIIQSMNDDESVIDLGYYRNQIETFEQEYSDVMLWVRPDKNGIIPVVKQADNVIGCYRGLLYSRKQIDNGRAELNYSEKEARRMLPELDDRIASLNADVERLKRLLDEESGKFNDERDKLMKRKGAIESELDKIRKKRREYEQAHIDDVISRVAKEPLLKSELQSLTTIYNELTNTSRDIIGKYEAMDRGLVNELQNLTNQLNAEIVRLRGEFNDRQSAMIAERDEQTDGIRVIYEEKLKTVAEKNAQLASDISSLVQQKTRIECSVHFKAEIDECMELLNVASAEQNENEHRREILNMECENLRKTIENEVEESDRKCDVEMEKLMRRREQIDAELESLRMLIDSSKGSFCEWLDKNRPGWHETIGRVADEKLVLYNQNLDPQLTDGGNTLYGVKINLAAVERELRTPEQIKAELDSKTEVRNGVTKQIAHLNEEKVKLAKDIKNRHKKNLSEKLSELHLLDIQLQLNPQKVKGLRANLSKLERDEAEWKRKRIEEIDIAIGEKEKDKRGCGDEENNLRVSRDKEIKQISDNHKKRVKREMETLDDVIAGMENELANRRVVIEAKRKELVGMRNDELSGKGADTSAIEAAKLKMDAIEGELKYISDNRQRVWSYEKDKNELFEREPQLREEKKDNELRLSDLSEKYDARKQKLSGQYCVAKTDRDGMAAESESLKRELVAVENFRRDENFCPPESYSLRELSTKKSCGKIVDELKGLIVSIGRDTENFKKAVNLFNGNFSARNTFNFPTGLASESDYMDFASVLCEFVEYNMIEQFQTRISERYVNIIRRMSKEVGNLTNNESDIHKTINDINSDFVKRNFAGVIRGIELRPQQSGDKLMQLLIEIKRFNEENSFNMGEMDLFSQDSRENVNLKAVKYLDSLSKLLKDEPSRKSLVVSDTFNLQFRVVENDNDTGWVEKIANVGSDGTDILVKAMVNIMLINVFKEKASRKFGDFKIHCMMDEIGKLHPNNVKGILDFANCRNILLINSSPTTYNVEDYKYTYLLSKDSASNTRIVPLLTRK